MEVVGGDKTYLGAEVVGGEVRSGEVGFGVFDICKTIELEADLWQSVSFVDACWRQ